MTAILSSSQTADGIPADSTMPAPPCVTGQPEPTQGVSDRLHHRLTDAERENAIHKAGDIFLRYMKLYEDTGDFQYRGDADRALRLQSLLIKGRSPEQVARMEKERGLA